MSVGWTCRKCGVWETDPTVVMSVLEPDSLVINFEHLDGACVILLTDDDFWRECWSD